MRSVGALLILHDFIFLFSIAPRCFIFSGGPGTLLEDVNHFDRSAAARASAFDVGTPFLLD